MTAPKNTLPALSNANITEGMWYVFYDGDNVIRAWGSSWTGFERVYYNDIILQSYSCGSRREQCSFKKNDHFYQIRCKTKNLQRWQVECELWKDRKIVQVIKCKRRKLWNIRPTLAHLWVGLGAGLISGVMKVPGWFGIIFVFVVLATTLLTTAKTGDFIFESE